MPKVLMRKYVLILVVIFSGAIFPTPAPTDVTQAPTEQAASPDYDNVKQVLLSDLRVKIIQLSEKRDMACDQYIVHMDSLAQKIMDAKVTDAERASLWNTLLAQALTKPTFWYNSDNGKTTITPHTPTTLFKDNFPNYTKKLLEHLGVSVGVGALFGMMMAIGASDANTLQTTRRVIVSDGLGELLLDLILFFKRRALISTDGNNCVKTKKIFFCTTALCSIPGIFLSLHEYLNPSTYHLNICSDIETTFFGFVEKHAQNMPSQTLAEAQKLRQKLEETSCLKDYKKDDRDLLFEHLAAFSEYFDTLEEPASDAPENITA